MRLRTVEDLTPGVAVKLAPIPEPARPGAARRRLLVSDQPGLVKMAAGLDFVVIGRGAILHHDFPKRVAANPDFTPIALPVSPDHLRSEGLGEPFVNYMRTWKGFVAEEAA